VIGEHLGRVRQIDEERFGEMADPTWYQVIGLRNVISHGYEIIDFTIIWRIVDTDLPELTRTLDTLESAS
jgi:uncharacterized protein with HEPN domain